MIIKAFNHKSELFDIIIFLIYLFFFMQELLFK